MKDYKPYLQPKRALFYQDGYVKDPETGSKVWSRVEKETIVIGEDDMCYIQYLKEYKICDTWDLDHGKTSLLPIGFHKSRLIKFLPTPGQQLLLFD